MIPVATRDIVWFDLADAVRVGRDGDFTVIEWPGFLRMRASTTHETVIEPLAEIAPAVLKKMQEGLGRALPHYLRGAVVFHAAAVAFEGRGILILGDSGAGKSTTAALLCARGATFIADDTAMGTIAEGRLWLRPLETAHWLDAASCRALGDGAADFPEKLSRPARPSAAPVRACAAVVLEVSESPGVVVTPLRGLEAAQCLLNAALRLPLDDERSKRDLDTLARVAQSLRTFRVLRGGDFSSTLQELPSRLLDLMERE